MGGKGGVGVGGVVRVGVRVRGGVVGAGEGCLFFFFFFFFFFFLVGGELKIIINRLFHFLFSFFLFLFSLSFSLFFLSFFFLFLSFLTPSLSFLTLRRHQIGKAWLLSSPSPLSPSPPHRGVRKRIRRIIRRRERRRGGERRRGRGGERVG